MFGGIGWMEIVILGLVGVLIFGKRLPEVGRNIGKGIVEFKKGLAGIEDEADKAAAHNKHLHPSDDAPTIRPAQSSDASTQNKNA